MGFMARKLAFIVAIIVAVVCIAPAASAQTRRVARCTVPRLSGDSLATARKRLDRAGCRVGRVHRPKTASGSLVVRKQSARPGRRLRHGARVGLWLRVKPAKVGTTAPTQTTTTTTTVPASPVSVPAPVPTPAPPVVHANIDPTFTQDPTNPLQVTWTYDAGVANGTLPVGVLTLSVTPDSGGLGPVGGCTMNVDATTTGGTCTVLLPSYGAYLVTVTYDGSSSGVAPSTQTEVDTITAPSGPVVQQIATTESVTVAQGLVSTGTGTASATDTISATTTDPQNSGYTITVTDETTGVSVTSAQQSDLTGSTFGCSLAFNWPGYEGNVVITGCGIYDGSNSGLSTSNPMLVAPGDALSVSVAITGSDIGTNDYLPSSSTPVSLPDPLAAY